MDIASGKQGQLADLWGNEPRVEHYRVNLDDLENVGANALENALTCDLMIVDEVGPMELQSNKFIQTVEKLVASDKPILAVVKLKLTILWLKVSSRPSSS